MVISVKKAEIFKNKYMCSKIKQYFKHIKKEIGKIEKDEIY